MKYMLNFEGFLLIKKLFNPLRVKKTKYEHSTPVCFGCDSAVPLAEKILLDKSVCSSCFTRIRRCYQRGWHRLITPKQFFSEFEKRMEGC